MELATEPVTDMPELIQRVENLTNQLCALTESHNRILALLESLESQFGPVMDGMKNGPIGKLMGL